MTNESFKESVKSGRQAFQEGPNAGNQKNIKITMYLCTFECSNFCTFDNVAFWLLQQNGCRPSIPSPIQSFMGPQQAAVAAAAAAAAMNPNFVLFPFLDQLHASAAAAAAGAFHNPLQSMQPFMQKNSVRLMKIIWSRLFSTMRKRRRNLMTCFDGFCSFLLQQWPHPRSNCLTDTYFEILKPVCFSLCNFSEGFCTNIRNYCSPQKIFFTDSFLINRPAHVIYCPDRCLLHFHFLCWSLFRNNSNCCLGFATDWMLCADIVADGISIANLARTPNLANNGSKGTTSPTTGISTCSSRRRRPTKSFKAER